MDLLKASRVRIGGALGGPLVQPSHLPRQKDQPLQRQDQNPGLINYLDVGKHGVKIFSRCSVFQFSWVMSK